MNNIEKTLKQIYEDMLIYGTAYIQVTNINDTFDIKVLDPYDSEDDINDLIYDDPSEYLCLDDEEVSDDRVIIPLPKQAEELFYNIYGRSSDDYDEEEPLDYTEGGYWGPWSFYDEDEYPVVSKTCTCGAHATNGKHYNFHAEWCDLYGKS